MPLECFCLEMSKSSIMNQIICIGFNCKGITLGEKQEFLSFWMKIRPKNSSLVSGNRKRKTKAKETKEKKSNICEKSNGIRWYCLRICLVYFLIYLTES